MKKAKWISVLMALLMLAGLLAACGGTPPNEAASEPQTSEAEPADSESALEPDSGPDGGVAILYAVFWDDPNDPDAVWTYEQEYGGVLVPEVITDGFTNLTGLDFFVDDVIFYDDNSVTIDWSADSTLVAGLDDREQKEEFHFFDQVSLRYFMLDSLRLSFMENFGVDEVYYTQNGGQQLVLEELLGTEPLVLDETAPYEGSAAYM